MASLRPLRNGSFAVATGCVAVALSRGATAELLGTASVAVLCALLVQLFVVRQRRSSQWGASRQKLKELLLWSEQLLREEDPDASRQLLDDVIGRFSNYARVIEKDMGGDAEQTATAQLHVLAEFLEATQVNRVFRIANWRWASKWDQGLADPGEVRSRLTVVFPTVITAARMYRAAGRRLHSSALAAETHSIEHLGCWCTDFMQQPGVAAFLSKRGEAPEAPKLLREATSGESFGDLSTDDSLMGGSAVDGPPRERGGPRCLSCCLGRRTDEHEEPPPTWTRHASGFGTPGLEVDRVGRRTRVGQGNCWDDVDPTLMMIRGPNYIMDRCKVLSESAMLELVTTDIYKTDEPAVHYAASKRVGNVVDKIRQRGDNRFLFIMNWLVTPWQHVVVWAMPDSPEWAASPEGRLWKRFIHEMDDDERNNRLKIVPRVIEAPGIVRRAVPETPSIVGRKLPISYFVAADHMEASINVMSSAIGRYTLNIMAGAAKAFSVEIYVLIEGQAPEELPERILGGFSVLRLDLDRLPVR